MGADIHWIAERKHPDGSWEAAFSKVSCRAVVPDWYRHINWMSCAQEQLGDRNYVLFGILSDVRGSQIPSLGQIAKQGLPEDCSRHTEDTFGDDDDLHSHGWYDVEMLKSSLEDIKSLPNGESDYAEEIEALEHHLGLIERVIANKEVYPVQIDNILFGREYDFDEDIVSSLQAYPDMRAESNHDRLQREARVEELLPIGPGTLRFCIAYDN